MTAIRSVRPRTTGAFRTLLRTELRLFGRDAGAVVWSAAAPLLALIVLGAFPAMRRPTDVLDGSSYLQAYLPILTMFSVCMTLVNVMPPVLAGYREKGILRRFSTTPVPPGHLLAAQIVIHVAIAATVAVAMLVVAAVFYGIHLPTQFAGYALSFALVASAATGIGACIAAVAPRERIANAVSFALFYPLMFLAGLWLPRAAMPDALRVASDLSPFGAGARAVQQSVAGHWPATTSLLVVLAYAVAFGGLAVRRFRWE